MSRASDAYDKAKDAETMANKAAVVEQTDETWTNAQQNKLIADVTYAEKLREKK